MKEFIYLKTEEKKIRTDLKLLTGNVVLALCMEKSITSVAAPLLASGLG